MAANFTLGEIIESAHNALLKIAFNLGERPIESPPVEQFDGMQFIRSAAAQIGGRGLAGFAIDDRNADIEATPTIRRSVYTIFAVNGDVVLLQFTVPESGRACFLL